MTFTAMRLLLHILFCCAAVLSTSPVYALDTNSTSGQKLYEVRNGQIYISGWDDRGPTEPVELLRLTPQDFPPPAPVYRERVLLQDRDVLTSPIVVPGNASELVIMARGQAIEDEFPFIRVTAIEEGSTRTLVLFEGFIKNLPLEPHICPVPSELRGRKVRLKLSPTNPAQVLDYRVAYIAYLAFR